MMPSTSDQIHNSSASSTEARIDAEKSEPPRPRVVGRPSSVAAVEAGDDRNRSRIEVSAADELAPSRASHP